MAIYEKEFRARDEEINRLREKVVELEKRIEAMEAHWVNHLRFHAPPNIRIGGRE